MSKDDDHGKWKTDFPISTEVDDFVTRRDFIRYLSVVSGGLALGNGTILATSMVKHEESEATVVDICKEDELKNGEWLVFHYPDPTNSAILIRRESGEHIAFTQKCPHLACPVSYRTSSEDHDEHIGCHCHNGKFDIETGKGVAGPPRELRPLKSIELKIENGRILAMGILKPKAEARI